MEDVPLWAFLAYGIIGPVVGAGLTVLGTSLTNRHASKEADKERKYKNAAYLTQWRYEQINQTYAEVFEFGEVLLGRVIRKFWETTPREDLTQMYEDGQATHLRLTSRLHLHSTKEVEELFVKFARYYEQIHRVEVNGANPEGISEEGYDRQLWFVRMNRTYGDLHNSIRAHLDTLQAA